MPNIKKPIKITFLVFFSIIIFISGYFIGYLSNSGKWTIEFYNDIKKEFGIVDRREDDIIGNFPLHYPFHMYIIVENGVKTVRVGNLLD